jgi:hypothetical protein
MMMMMMIIIIIIIIIFSGTGSGSVSNYVGIIYSFRGSGFDARQG